MMKKRIIFPTIHNRFDNELEQERKESCFAANYPKVEDIPFRNRSRREASKKCICMLIKRASLRLDFLDMRYVVE